METTMNADELRALAERVQGLDGPDRETDKAILLALGYSWRGMAYWFRDDSHAWNGASDFTASLDAAMTLVPENVSFQVTRRVPTEGCCADIDMEFHAGATTPALALTAAALLARAILLQP
jgi:hypothetical protein